jgi:hypothetical protein
VNAVVLPGSDNATSEPISWVFPFDTKAYRRRPKLSDTEIRVLAELGPAHLRRSRARGTEEHQPLWDKLSRLVRPLDDARAALRHPSGARYRRASVHAAGPILQHCAESGRAYWAFTAWDWARLCGGSAEKFLAARTLPTETTVRPFLVALAYLLGRFTDFHHLGTFNRLHLAQLARSCILIFLTRASVS